LNTPPGFGKKHFLSLARLLLLLPTVSFSIHAQPAQDSARQQIDAAAKKQATALIQQEAKKRGWPTYSAQLNVLIPAEVAQLSPCTKPLVSGSEAGSRLNLTRLRIDLRCNDQPGWNTSVTVKPDVSVPVVMASGALDRDHVVTADDLVLRKFSVSSSRADVFWQKDDVIGMTVKRRVREMTPLTANMLEAPVMVERGQRVAMIASQDGVTAQTTGLAMKKGRRGDIIKVKNESSGQQVSARVTDFGTVLAVAKTGK
jgi:flagella basal body P-ring formation protein FlgA